MCKGIWDESVPGIIFDEKGVSNYAKMFQKFVQLYPRGKEGLTEWNRWLKRIKKDGKIRNMIVL